MHFLELQEAVPVAAVWRPVHDSYGIVQVQLLAVLFDLPSCSTSSLTLIVSTTGILLLLSAVLRASLLVHLWQPCLTVEGKTISSSSGGWKKNTHTGAIPPLTNNKNNNNNNNNTTSISPGASTLNHFSSQYNQKNTGSVEQSNNNITEQSNSSWGAHQVFLFLAKFRHFLTKKLRKFSFRKILFFKCKFDYFCYFLVKFHQNFDTQKNEKKSLGGVLHYNTKT